MRLTVTGFVCGYLTLEQRDHFLTNLGSGINGVLVML